MNGAIVVRWGAPVPGREAKGLDVFGRAVEHFEGQAKQGRIHGHHEYLALTGRAGGMMVIEGEVDELQKILVEPDTLRLNTQAEAICQDFEICLYAGGNDKTVQEVIGTFAGALTEMGYM
jgi:hypothetical protein